MSDPFAQAAADILGSALGKDAAFTAAAGGAASDCRALLSRNLEITDTYGSVIEVAIAIDLPREVAGLPERGATVVIDGTTYRVERVVRYDDHLVTVSCSHG